MKRLQRRKIIQSLACAGLLGVSHIAFASEHKVVESVRHDKNTGPIKSINVGKVSSVSNSMYQDQFDTPSQKKIFESGYAIKELGKEELKDAGPQAGPAQVLAFAPGVNVSGSYGSSGASKDQISINGVTTGWQGFSGADANNGSIMVTFDGIPMNNLSTGLWQSPDVSNMSILNGIQLTYGPGPVANRFYDNIGGSINFQPLEPTKHAQGKITQIMGSNKFYGTNFSADTGEYDGWAAVLAGGFSSGNDYFVGSDGFAHPFHSYTYYGKIMKKFNNGRFSIGALDSKGFAYRPDPIPVEPVPGLTLTSDDAAPGAILYSEPTTGYYTTVPEKYNDKYDTNHVWMVYAKLHLRMDKHFIMDNSLWYRYGHRIHYKTVTPFHPTYELENPGEHNYGDKLAFSTDIIPYNKVNFGGYFIYSDYLTNQSPNPLSHHYRANYFDQTALALFLQDAIKPYCNLTITPGIRVVNYNTHYNFDTPGYYPAAYAADPGIAQGTIRHGSQDSFTKLEGSLSANYRPTKWLALFASWGNSYRQPPTGGGGGPYQGIAPGHFGLEASTEYQAGLKMHFRNLAFLHHFIAGANWYFLHWTDKYIPYSIEVDGQKESVSAFGSTDYQGVNIFANDDLFYNLHAFVNASFEQARYINYRTKGINYSGLPASYVPGILVNAGLSYKKFVDGVLLKARGWFNYTGSQNIFNNNTGLPSKQTMPSFGTLNASLGSTIPIHSFSIVHAVGLNLSLLNILNSHYNLFEEISSGGQYNTAASGYRLGLPGSPFTVYGSLTLKF